MFHGESLTTEHACKVLEENRDIESEDTCIEEDVQKKRGRPRTRPIYPKKHSATDPEATMVTSNKSQRLEPSYKQHTMVDDKTGIIVDIELTTGEVNEGTRLIEGVNRLEAITGKKIERVTADASYAHPKTMRRWKIAEPTRSFHLCVSGQRHGIFRLDGFHMTGRTRQYDVLQVNSCNVLTRWRRVGYTEPRVAIVKFAN